MSFSNDSTEDSRGVNSLTPIDLELSRKFAALSGDWNPLHVDSEAARRLLFGGTVCHGVHIALAGVERVLSSDKGLAALNARFVGPAATGSALNVRASVSGAGGRTEFAIVAGDANAVLVRCVPAPVAPADARAPGAWPTAPVVHDFDSASTDSGIEDTGFDAALAAELFPGLAARAPTLLGLALAATRIVGMRCPGAHSIFISMNLKVEPGAPLGSLTWRVGRSSKAVSMLWIEIAGDGMSGTIEVLMRPRPSAQIAFDAVVSRVARNAFLGRKALVVGGSRGLGEVATKILAAGGAVVTVGYHLGAADAQRIVYELRMAGASAQARRIDALAPPDDVLRDFNRLYYFAAPRIRPNRQNWDPALFALHAGYYVHALGALLGPGPLGEIAVFQPSTRFLDAPEPGFAEYAAAKAASEAMLAQLAVARGLRFAAPRLPRLATDQTSALAHQRIDALDPFETMLDAVAKAEAAW